MAAGGLILRQLNEQGAACGFAPLCQPHHKGAGHCHHQAQQVHGVGRQHGVAGEEHLGKQHVDGKPGAAGHKRRYEHGLIPIPLILQGPGGHHRGHTAPKAQNHGDERPARQAQLAHNAVHHIGHPGHIAAVLQKGQGQKQNDDIGQKGQDAPHAGDDAIHNQRGEHGGHAHGVQPAQHPAGDPVQAQLEVLLQPIAHCEGEEEDQGHNAQKDGQAPKPVGKQFIRPVGDCGALLPIDHNLLDNLVNKVIFLVDDVLLIAPVQHVRAVDWVLFQQLPVPLQQLDGVPAVVGQLWIAGLQGLCQLVNFVLYLVAVDHSELAVVLVLVPRPGALGRGPAAVVVNQRHI